jgi:hypothetical protein
MSDASATIIAALIGFVGGLVVAAFTFRQKADELFLAGLQYLEGGSQKRNLGIAALELSWSSRRHRRVIAPLLVGVALYLLSESKQQDAAHEIENLRSIMKLLTSKKGRSCLGADQRTTLLQVLRKRYGESDRGQGLWVEKRELDDWIKLMEATG